MPFRHAFGLNNLYAIHVRVELDEKGDIAQVFHKDFNIEYLILRIDKCKKELIFQHTKNKRKYKIKY